MGLKRNFKSLAIVLSIFAGVFSLISWGNAGTSTWRQIQGGNNFGFVNGIQDTPHNLAFVGMTTISSVALNQMNDERNNYGEICVYCHTPHAASIDGNSWGAGIDGLLWNRTINASTYTQYDTIIGGVSTPQRVGNFTITQPGPNSLTCLSCHDGTIAIDSVINMPTVNGTIVGTLFGGLVPVNVTISEDGWNPILQNYDPAANPDDAWQGNDQEALLDVWANNFNLSLALDPGGVVTGSVGGPGPEKTGTNTRAWHGKLAPGPASNPGAGNDFTGENCFQCHSASGGISLSDPNLRFEDVYLGTDLRDDHPIGVLYPTSLTPGINFNLPTHTAPATTTNAATAWFTRDANSRMDTYEIRLYDSGDGFEVECASCHDPHGVPNDGTSLGAGTGAELTFSFLRVDNGDQSALCLTCHDK